MKPNPRPSWSIVSHYIIQEYLMKWPVGVESALCHEKSWASCRTTWKSPSVMPQTTMNIHFVHCVRASGMIPLQRSPLIWTRPDEYWCSRKLMHPFSPLYLLSLSFSLYVSPSIPLSQSTSWRVQISQRSRRSHHRGWCLATWLPGNSNQLSPSNNSSNNNSNSHSSWAWHHSVTWCKLPFLYFTKS